MSETTSQHGPTQLPSQFRALRSYEKDIGITLDSHFHRCHALTEEQRKKATEDPTARQSLLYANDSNDHHVRDSISRLPHTLRHRIDRHALSHPHARYAEEGKSLEDRQKHHRESFPLDRPSKDGSRQRDLGAHISQHYEVPHRPLDQLEPKLSSKHTRESMHRLHQYIFYKYIRMTTEELALRMKGKIPSDDRGEPHDTNPATLPGHHYPPDKIYRPGMMPNDMIMLKRSIARSVSSAGPVSSDKKDAEFWKWKCNQSFEKWMQSKEYQRIQEHGGGIHVEGLQRGERTQSRSNSPAPLRLTLRKIHDAVFTEVYDLQKAAFEAVTGAPAKARRVLDNCVYSADIMGYVFAYLYEQCEELRMNQRLPANQREHHKVRSYLTLLSDTFGDCMSSYLDEDPAYLRNIWDSHYIGQRDAGIWLTHERRLEIAVMPGPAEHRLFDAADRFVPVWLCETAPVDPSRGLFHNVDLCVDAWETSFFGAGHTSANYEVNRGLIPERERGSL